MFFQRKLAELKLITFYLFAAIFTDLFLNPISKVFFNSPFLASKIFTFFEFTLVSIYLFPLIKLKVRNKFFAISSLLFVATIFTENILEKNQNFDSISTGVSALIILIYSIMHLFSRVNENTNYTSFKIDASFLTTSSFIFYFSGTFFIYILSKNYFLDNNFQYSYSLINALVLIIRNFIICISFLMSLKISFRKNNTFTHSEISI